MARGNSKGKGNMRFHAAIIAKKNMTNTLTYEGGLKEAKKAFSHLKVDYKEGKELLHPNTMQKFSAIPNIMKETMPFPADFYENLK